MSALLKVGVENEDALVRAQALQVVNAIAVVIVGDKYVVLLKEHGLMFVETRTGMDCSIARNDNHDRCCRWSS